jgi:Raf kinase inhibitor-like YbhB/YbcL family protein
LNFSVFKIWSNLVGIDSKPKEVVMMRNLIWLIFLLCCSINLFAQAPDLYFTRGSIITVKSSDVDVNLQEFTKKPKIYGVIDRRKKARMKVVTKVNAKTHKQSVIAEWTKSVKLYNKKDYRKIQIGPKLVAHPIVDKEITSIDVLAKKDIGPNAVSLPNKIYIAAPVIERISGNRLNTDDTFVVIGKYFGRRLPKIMIEYQRKGKWKYKKCKIDKAISYRYQDAKGRENKSCMKILSSDPADSESIGYSEVTVRYPKLKPTDARSGYLIIDNHIGINAIKMLSLTSASFEPGETIPAKYTNLNMVGGENISPALTWEDPPAKTKSFVITCIDLFDKADNWANWMVIDIPLEVRTLPEGASVNNMPVGSVELLNKFAYREYGGPQPLTTAVHQYAFTIYAMDVETLGLDPGLAYTNAELLDKMQGKIIEKATVIGKVKQTD